jgi:hypothetical protein
LKAARSAGPSAKAGAPRPASVRTAAESK